MTADFDHHSAWIPQQPVRRPAVRIVHRGGPAGDAKVYIDGKDVSEHVVSVALTLNADESGNVMPWVVFDNAEIDVTGELVPKERGALDGPVYYRITPIVQDAAEVIHRPFLILGGGLAVSAAAGGFAWWMWQLSGWWATALFVLTVICGGAWTLGMLWAAMGAGIAGHEPADRTGD